MLMPKLGLSRSFVLALCVAALPVLAGCSSNPFTPPTDDGNNELPATTPLNDSPENTMARFEATYEYRVKPEYEKLFTSNFRFTFSNQSDPELFNTWGTSWGKDDEIESTGNLITGFTDSEGNPQAAAASIELTLEGASFVGDPTRPESTAFYKYVIVPRVRMHLILADGREFEIDAPHDFYLVRGDVAVLDETQEARSDRWYIHRWDDKSPPLAAIIRVASQGAEGGAERRTWGDLKASYTRLP